VPLPSVSEAEWFRPFGNAWETNAETAHVMRDPRHGAEMLHVAWAVGEMAPVVEVTSRIATRDVRRSIEARKCAAAFRRGARILHGRQRPGAGRWHRPRRPRTGSPPGLTAKSTRRERYTNGSSTTPTVTAAGTRLRHRRHRRDAENGKFRWQMRRYQCLVRRACPGNPACRRGTSTASASAPSRFGYRSLGANAEIITGAQHCRAEVWLTGFGWVAMDPATCVRSCWRSPGQSGPRRHQGRAARKALFGSWEGIWLAYNTANDVTLPARTAAKSDS